jgi:hypothetical protein
MQGEETTAIEKIANEYKRENRGGDFISKNIIKC